MHHPDICNVLLAIEDFLLFSDERSNCEIIPQPYYNDKNGYDILIQQICIRRKLTSGWLEIIIHGLDKDSNLNTCEYLTCLEPRKCAESIEIRTEGYSIDKVKYAVRKIIIMDKKPQPSSLDAIRNLEIPA